MHELKETHNIISILNNYALPFSQNVFDLAVVVFFFQIYSRKPVPGPKFIEKYKSYLEDFGYDSSAIKDTPQDCEVMSANKLSAMMSMPGMQKALTNEFPNLELSSSVEFNPFTSVFDTLKKLVQLYFK